MQHTEATNLWESLNQEIHDDNNLKKEMVFDQLNKMGKKNTVKQLEYLYEKLDAINESIHDIEFDSLPMEW